jgi:rhodanese-related sulfurtransferase
MTDHQTNEIDAEKAKGLIHQNADSVFIIDVRSPEEYAQMHIPEAVNIPLAELKDRAAEIPKGKMIISTCHAGGNRSRIGAETLQEMGYADAAKLTGGTCAWLGVEPQRG